jgi:hypothetical protein
MPPLRLDKYAPSVSMARPVLQTLSLLFAGLLIGEMEITPFPRVLNWREVGAVLM